MMDGFYRVNLPQASANISVLAMNSISFSVKNVNKEDAGEQDVQLEWLEDQLATAEKQRKFIISNHIYFGTQVKGGKVRSLWTDDYTRRYAAIMERYADRIIIELSGHEHVGDVRYHEGSVLNYGSPLIQGLTTLQEQQLNLNYVSPPRYHNMLIDPGMTAFDGANPGFSLLQLDLARQ